MAVHFILGGSGRGKSYYVNHKLVSLAEKEPSGCFIMLVPEQATMQTQKEIVQISRQKGIINIEVQSFVRLAYRVFAETGAANLPVLDDMGKTMILHKVLMERENELKYFGKNVHKKGYVAQIKSFLSEMMQYGVDDETLQDMIDSAEGKTALQRKLEDMRVAYTAFQSYLENHYITSEEVLGVLSSVVSESKLLRDAVICLDGFTGFTPVQYQLIHQLMSCCREIYVTVTLGEGEEIFRPGPKHGLYYMSRKTTTRFWKLARENNLEEPELVRVGEKLEETRFREAPGLEHLERQLFRYPSRQYEKAPEDISIHVLRQPQDEIAFVVRQIMQLRRQGCRNRDIAVVTGDMEVYGPLARGAFLRAGLPCFIDQKKSILANPFVSMLDALLDVVLTDFKYEPVIRYLRARYSPLERNQVDLLDNYLLATGLRGHKSWAKEWSCDNAFPIRDEESAAAVTEKLNEARGRVWDTFHRIYEQWGNRKHTVREFAVGIVEFMEEQKFYNKLQNDVDAFQLAGDAEMAKEYEQIYRIVLDVLDRLVELLGEERTSLREFRELLDTGFCEARVGMIPPGVDQIVVGDLTRTRLSHIRYLFFLGMTDANIPQGTGGGGVLSSFERSFLEQEDFELAPTERENIYTEQFYLYLTLTKPQKHLYLCLCEAGNDGKEQKPAYLLERIRKIFPKLEITVEEQQRDAVHIVAADRGLSYLIGGLRSKNYDDKSWREIYRYYWKDEKRRQQLAPVLKAAFYHAPETKLTKMAARLLYQDILRGSASKLELYASCAYRYFLQYGLCLREREERAVAFYDIGNIIHNSLELYTKRLLDEGAGWQEIDEEQQRKRAEECFYEVVDQYKNGILQDTCRNKHLVGTLQRILHRTIQTITKQMEQGDFQTVGSELRFEQLYGPLRLVGSVDRVDRLETQQADYITIVDYKTGQRSVSLSDLYYGLQMQLVIYLQAAVSREKRRQGTAKKVIPAGVFYFHPDDPMLKEYVAEESREKEIMRQLRMRGLFNEEDEVLYAMDKQLRPDTGSGLASSRRSDVAAIATKKDGTLSAQTSGATTTEEFELLMEYTSDKLQAMSREILDGRIDMHPYRRENGQEACEYCPYHAVCQFDSRLPGHEYHTLQERTSEEIFEELRGRFCPEKQ